MEKFIYKLILLFVTLLTAFGCSTVFNNNNQITENVETSKKIRSLGYSATPEGFYRAAADGKIKVLKLFLDSGYDVNSNGIGLMCAIQKNQLETVKFLIKNGADINAMTFLGCPLGFSVSEDKPKIVKLLLDNGAEVDIHAPQDATTPLFDAAIFGYDKIAEILIKHNAEVNYINPVTDDSILIAVSKRGNAEIAKLLLESGANVNYSGKNGYSALDWAAFSLNNKTAEYLLKYGANLYNKDGICRSCVMEAFYNRNFALIKLFFKYGLSADSRVNNGVPLIVWCEKLKFKKGVKILREHSADYNASDKYGKTATDYKLIRQNSKKRRMIQSRAATMNEIDSYNMEKFKKENKLK